MQITKKMSDYQTKKLSQCSKLSNVMKDKKKPECRLIGQSYSKDSYIFQCDYAEENFFVTVSDIPTVVLFKKIWSDNL